MTKHVSPEYNYTHLGTSTATAVQIATGRTILHYITVNTTTAATIGIIDGTAGSLVSSNVARIKASVAEGTLRYDATLSAGLRIAPSGHLGDITICWSQA